MLLLCCAMAADVTVSCNDATVRRKLATLPRAILGSGVGPFSIFFALGLKTRKGTLFIPRLLPGLVSFKCVVDFSKRSPFEGIVLQAMMQQTLPAFELRNRRRDISRFTS